MNFFNKAIKILFNSKRLFLYILDKSSRLWPDALFLKCKFRLMIGRKLDLKKPKTFNEKLQWLKLYDRNPEYTMMVDKYTAKEYISAKIGDEYVIPTLGVWNSVDEIEWGKLPEKFVLKTTQGGGSYGVIICKDKHNFDIEDVKVKLETALNNTDIYLNFREWPYKNITKRIIAEKYMTEADKGDLKDYKFFCFNGKVKVLKIDFDRFIEHRANYFDRELNLLPFGEVLCPPNFNKKLERPENFDKMLQIAETISSSIPFVRVDLYNSNGKIYFGEMTFYPASGLGKFDPDEWDIKMGEWLTLPNKNC